MGIFVGVKVPHDQVAPNPQGRLVLQAAVAEDHVVRLPQGPADQIIVSDLCSADDHAASHHLASVQAISQNASS